MADVSEKWFPRALVKLHVTSDKAERPLGRRTPSISLTVLLIYYTCRSRSWEMNGAPHRRRGKHVLVCERKFLCNFCAIVIKLWASQLLRCCRPMITPIVFLQPFLSSFFPPLSRPCKARGPLCHMSESCNKDCKPRKAQRIRVNEGKISFFLLEISDLLLKQSVLA